MCSWAIESRVYAEDPLRKFLPSIGPLATYIEPEQFNEDGKVIRIDTGVYEGGEISMYYDPMIAKLIVSGPDRGARQRRPRPTSAGSAPGQTVGPSEIPKVRLLVES